MSTSGSLKHLLPLHDNLQSLSTVKHYRLQCPSSFLNGCSGWSRPTNCCFLQQFAVAQRLCQLLLVLPFRIHFSVLVHLASPPQICCFAIPQTALLTLPASYETFLKAAFCSVSISDAVSGAPGAQWKVSLCHFCLLVFNVSSSKDGIPRRLQPPWYTWQFQKQQEEES